MNLKIPRNNQLLHFAFREDKQWKLQQVVGPFPCQGSSHKLRQAGAGLSSTEASWGGHGGLKAAASLGGRFLAAKLAQAVPGAPEPRLEGGENLFCL